MRRWFPMLCAVAAASMVGAAAPRAPIRQTTAPQAAEPSSAKPLPSIADKTAGLQKMDGFFPLYWDADTGALYLEIPKLDTEVLYQTGLGAGMGSNDVGLDRGLLVDTRVVKFERVGRKVLMVQPNYLHRAASTTNPDERKAVTDAFATSVLWGFTVTAETGDRVLVDLTDFLMRDATGIADRLKPASYRFDKSRSAVYLPNTKSFPKNTEIEVISTYTTDSLAGNGPGETGGRIADVVPSPDAMTIRQHHSLIELPDDGYAPRVYDPRSGFFDLSYADYAAPLGADMQTRFITRHRLVKKDPNAAMSDPVTPIVYYVDRGAPEPVRSALIEGAGWWNQAFEAAGFRNAFRVEVMPEGADPMDVRYNVIDWVSRSTRGWSYGDAIADPRTGEILQGHVSLDSLRAREDYVIFEGLLSPYRQGTEQSQEITGTVLARIRQLGAHETGHTLGLAHNYYDSAAGRISVMDYPQPLITLRADGSLDMSQAYASGIGAWDKVAIAYGYSQFPAGTDEHAALTKILDDAWSKDLRFLTNQDMDVNPKVDQWSNGVDQAAELNRIMDVRRAALSRFGEDAIRQGAPMATIEDALVPVYMYHRYSTESAASILGGQNYVYALRGDGRTPTAWASAADQKAALDALVRTLRPSELTLSKTLLAEIPPRPQGYDRTRELFPRYTAGAFDPIMPAVVASDMTIGFVLERDRAARLVAQRAVDPTLPGLDDVVARLIAATFDVPATGDYEAEVKRAEERVLASHLMDLAAGSPMSEVRAIATFELKAIQRRADTAPATLSVAERAHRQLLASDIQHFLDRPGDAATRIIAVPPPPPGAPIGEPPLEYLLGLTPICGTTGPGGR